MIVLRVTIHSIEHFADLFSSWKTESYYKLNHKLMFVISLVILFIISLYILKLGASEILKLISI